MKKKKKIDLVDSQALDAVRTLTVAKFPVLEASLDVLVASELHAGRS